MYNILIKSLSQTQIVMLGILVTFVITFIALKFPFSFLPTDQGRAYAVNGALSKGKTRGVGLTLVVCYILGMVVFMPMKREFIIYAILLACIMLSGYMDDAAKNPWSDYKKGLIDLVISAIAVITFVNFNSTTIYFGTAEITLPKAVYIILGIILFWISINVTNCSDGVDGLCATLCIIVLFSFSVIFNNELDNYAMSNFFFIATLLAYLYFNSSPSSMLMGDAGSRALGFYIAIIAIKSGHPFIYLLLAAMLIIDGGLGLVKIFLKRFFKICILTKTRTPIHDHVRKNYGWSDAQVVIRFMIIQIFFAVIAYMIML